MEVGIEYYIFAGSVLLFIGILMSKTSYRTGMPILLVFMFVGMFFGCDGVGIEFHEVNHAQTLGIFALNIILFSGGMETRFKDIRPVLQQGILLSTAGVLLTTLFTGLFIFWISDKSPLGLEMSLITSLLLAATMSSTDSASVFNVLRTQKIGLKYNLRSLLELESGSNDPMAYMLTVTFIQLLTAGSTGITGTLTLFVLQFVIGGLGGFLLGKLSVWILERIKLENPSLYPILLLSIVFIIYTVTNVCQGNGYLAVYIAGILVGNASIPNRKETQTFMDGIIWLFQIMMFIVLGLLVKPHEMLDMFLVALLISGFMILIARPLSVFLCLSPFRRMNIRSKLFISWVGLRGAAPIIFATYPVVADIPGSGQLFNIVFFVTILSLMTQGVTIPRVARWLRLDQPLIQEEKNFGVEIPAEINTELGEFLLTADMLKEHNRLKDMKIPQGALVILVKREDEYLIPNGQMELLINDRVLILHKKDST
ncbi:potassium/proton antiporter [Parabacteroides distasonis]|uniref:potassium/proton antiporter n=1 Tax=Parabacteroides distasonis TaxID=823 RepID=UPI00189DA65B|nr:potassium/proton antiporter [Parabacteroides distasonis]MDB9152943.1 potassium/proton antiporter [Parabacteroides distasonis]MDB9157520.1 potassium/proton antiporter [Parabacteroides distasonis]MDB9163943.1 potassium/proton antiporter [Parabacteroides distasonis]MDB9167815.1 potassium/proton antiporter [Parabacteroides distasonis]MDB9193642.1 potassium/proton antiporter [Parabacteroides distasonis]